MAVTNMDFDRGSASSLHGAICLTEPLSLIREVLKSALHLHIDEGRSKCYRTSKADESGGMIHRTVPKLPNRASVVDKVDKTEFRKYQCDSAPELLRLICDIVACISKRFGYDFVTVHYTVYNHIPNELRAMTNHECFRP